MMAAAGGTQPWSLVLSGPQEGVAARALAQPVSLGARLSREQHHAELVTIAADGVVGRGIVLLQHDLQDERV